MMEHPPMDRSSDDLEGGEIHIHDNWQIELKSEFLPHLQSKYTIYTQEFWIFIPNSLQINDQTYSKEGFYLDQTNLLRYKTPDFTFEDLLSSSQLKSPLARMRAMLVKSTEASITTFNEELKLFGNVVRTILRKSAQAIYLHIQQRKSDEELCLELELLANEMRQLRLTFASLKKEIAIAFPKPNTPIHVEYIEEFLSNSYYHYLSRLLQIGQSHETYQQFNDELTHLLLQEQHYRQEHGFENLSLHQSTEQGEYFLYRQGLLNKYVLDALLLHSNRIAVSKKYQQVVSSLAAGVAMLIYLLLFIWQGEVFRINSEPFVVFTVLIYILKDRIKENLKTLSFDFGGRLFSDYTTQIRSPHEQRKLGFLREYFAFVKQDKAPKEATLIRNHGLQHVLEDIRRPEQILYIKKEIQLSNTLLRRGERRNALNVLFRLNMRRFLDKASNPEEPYLFIDPDTNSLIEWWLPKVYHINIVLKTSVTSEHGKVQEEWSRFRLILDKQGIRRLEKETHF